MHVLPPWFFNTRDAWALLTTLQEKGKAILSQVQYKNGVPLDWHARIGSIASGSSIEVETSLAREVRNYRLAWRNRTPAVGSG
jgi:hypothetical protein